MYAELVHRYACAYQESMVCMGVCWVSENGEGVNLHAKALLKALVNMILWFNYDVVNVVLFYLVTISDATNGNNKDLLN